MEMKRAEIANKDHETDNRASRRKAFSYTGAIERFLTQAEEGKLPIQYRKRDCERVNGIAMTINNLYERGQIEELRKYLAKIAISIVDSERINPKKKTEK